LRAGLESPSAFIQQASAFSLANIGDRQSLPAIEHLRDTEWVGLFRSTFAAAAQQLSVAPK
jgi:HEAT repeat protein